MTKKKNIVVHSLGELKKYGIKSVAVAIGVFDGVHKGHQCVLAELVKIAKETKSVPVAMTFEPHPKAVLPHVKEPARLIPGPEKARLLTCFGAKAVVVVPFNLKFARLSPDAFLDQCLYAEGIELKGVCVGSQWRFGAKAAGGKNDLIRRAVQDGFLFSAVNELKLEDQPVSSTRIRNALANGELELAAKMLGRFYPLFGHVIHGFGLAGSKLGYPTANLAVQCGVLPPYGVYAARVHLNGNTYPSVVSIGIAPTIRGDEKHPAPKIEAHLLNFSGNLYGKELSIELIKEIRGERKFQSLDELKQQISSDATVAADILKEGANE